MDKSERLWVLLQSAEKRNSQVMGMDCDVLQDIIIKNSKMSSEKGHFQERETPITEEEDLLKRLLYKSVLDFKS